MKYLEKVYQYIEENREVYIDWLLKASKQPSVSTLNIGMEKMAKMVEQLLEEVDADIEYIETEGYPIVYGEIKNNNEKTLSFYNHYDVQPEDPVDEWDTEPFEPTIIDGRLFGRGTADNKGNLLARVCAVHAYQQVYGKLPVDIKFVFEGEEEVGSPNLMTFAKEHPEKMETDGFLWEGGERASDGGLDVGLGVKGICYVELVARAGNRDLHSSEAPVIENPAWRLVWALNTLKNEQEEILIDGFYDDIIPVTEEEIEFIKNIPVDEETMLKERGLSNFLHNVSGLELKKKLFLDPTCTICGIESGYTDEGSKTVLPSKAMVKIDFRLAAGQSPERVGKLLRKHLDKHGYEDIEIHSLHGIEPHRTNVKDPLVQAAIESAREVYDKEPTTIINSAGSSPMYKLLKKEPENIPGVQIGVANKDSRPHAPNENIYIEDFILGIKMTAAVMDKFSKTKE